MLEYIDLANVLFLDIETVPAVPSFDDLADHWKDLWKTKARNITRKTADDLTEEEIADVYERAGIYPEFGKIICISVGALYADKETGDLKLRLKSFSGDDEMKILEAFSRLLFQKYNKIESNSLIG